MNELLLQLKDVSYRVKSGQDELSILNNINLSLKPGQTIAITGASGSGKTSLLSIMAGLLHASSGEVYFNNQRIDDLSESERARVRAHHIGFIFQSFELLPNLTAIENVMLPLEIHHKDHAYESSLKGLEALGLKARAHHYPQQLSGGEMQRVAIARAFITSPRLIFADEPTGNLDKKTANIVIDNLFSLNEKNHTALVLVTHDEALAKLCEKQYPLSEGQLLCA